MRLFTHNFNFQKVIVDSDKNIKLDSNYKSYGGNPTPYCIKPLIVTTPKNTGYTTNISIISSSVNLKCFHRNVEFGNSEITNDKFVFQYPHAETFVKS